jgi:hypothetical protein
MLVLLIAGAAAMTIRHHRRNRDQTSKNAPTTDAQAQY